MKILNVCNHMLFRESMRRIFMQLDDQLDIKEESHLGIVEKKIDIYSDAKLLVHYTGSLSDSSILAIRKIHTLNPNLSIVVLSETNNKSEIQAVIEAGAQSYISMASAVEDLLEGLKKVLRGETYISASIDNSDISMWNFKKDSLSSNHTMNGTSKNFDLSARQDVVLNMMMLGKSNKEIARSMEIGEGTVKSYCSIIYRKLEVENRTQAIIRAKEAIS